MLTLLEAAKLMDNPLAQGVVETFANVNPVLERIQFADIAGNSYRYNQEGTLPGIAFRGINGSYTESTGVLNPQTEALTIVGGDSDYDVALVKMGTGNGQLRAAHDAMKAKALSLTWLKTFFKGDTDSDQLAFDGLEKRLTGGQVLDAGTGGAALTLDMVDELIDAVRGDNKVLFCNRALRRKISALVRASGAAVETVTDAFGRQLMGYGGAVIAPVDEDSTDSPILGFTEGDGAGNNDTSSIYCAAFGLDRLHGIQTESMDVRDLGELQTKPAFRTRIEWYSGIVVKHPRAAARLRYVNEPA
ncbi:MAG: hypothetical protein HYU59_02350 [Magnetospirillum gryphiswaldense]|nr:hypothetical protein [Magnetospirillum gryphiswaldense]